MREEAWEAEVQDSPPCNSTISLSSYVVRPLSFLSSPSSEFFAFPLKKLVEIWGQFLVMSELLGGCGSDLSTDLKKLVSIFCLDAVPASCIRE